MAVSVKQILSFPDGGRIHLKPYGSLEELTSAATLNVDTPQEFLEEEQKRSALYLRTLTGIMTDPGKHYDLKAEELFSGPVDRSVAFSPQAHLVVLNFKSVEKGVVDTLGPSESTTRYKSYYNFVRKKFDPSSEATAICSVLAWDSRAVELLQKNGQEESLKRFGKDFLTLADLADHGYLHQIIDHRSTAIKHYFRFAPTGADAHPGIREKTEGKTTSSALEDMVLSLHARILGKLFVDSPKRKAKVLEYAARSFEELATMQSDALSKCHFWERGRVNEAVTYLAELNAHRLFRIFSPDDMALNEKTATGSSVIEAMNKLSVITPPELYKRDGNRRPSSGFDALKLNCSDWLGETYQAIHRMDHFPVLVRRNISDAEEIMEPTAEGLLAMLAHEAPRGVKYKGGEHQPDPKGYLERILASRSDEAGLSAQAKESSGTMILL